MQADERHKLIQKYPATSPYHITREQRGLGPLNPEGYKRNRRTVAEKEHDMARLAFMYLERWPLVDIAAELGISYVQVTKDLNLMRETWRNYVGQAYDLHVGEALARIDRLEMMCLMAWEKSTQPYERTSTGSEREVAPAGQDENGTPQRLTTKQKEKAQITRNEREGNPKWIELMIRLNDQRARILGLYSPDVIMMAGGNNRGGQPSPKIPMSEARDLARRAVDVHRALGPGALPLDTDEEWAGDEDEEGE